MPTILYVVTRPIRGGVQNHIIDLVESFRTDYRISLAVGGDGFLPQRAEQIGIPVHRLPDLVPDVDPIRDWRAYRQIEHVIRKERPDLIHLHSFKAGLLGRIAARASRIPCVFTVHGWAFARGVPFHRKLVGVPVEWLAARVCDRMIAVSQEDRDLGVRYSVVPAKSIEVIHNGIPDCDLRAEPANAPIPKIVVVARFEPQKDHDVLLRALALIKSDYRLLLVGDGPHRAAAEHLASNLRIRDKVEFLGARHDVPEILSRAQMFVLPSKWEGFPIAILEAMRSALPVVASDVGGVREAVIEGVTGFLVNRGDREAMARRIASLLECPETRRKMGEAGRKIYEANFTRERMIAKTRAVYDACLAPRQAELHAQPRGFQRGTLRES